MSQDPNAAGAPEGVAPAPESGQPQPTGAAIQSDLSRIDLTQYPQFRDYQSAQDRKAAQLQAQLQQMQLQLAQQQQVQQQATLANLDKLDPEERAAAYKQQYEASQAEQRKFAERNQILQQGQQLLAAAGIQANDPRIADIIGLEPNQQTLTMLATRVAQVAGQEREAAVAAANKLREDRQTSNTQAVQAAAQTAKVDALNQAGVTATSSAVAQVIAPTGEKDRLVAALKTELTKARGKGVDSAAYRDFMQKFRSSGLGWADLGY